MCNLRKGGPVGFASPLIVKVSTPEYKKVIVEASDGNRYYSELSALEKVNCFPQDLSQWEKVTPDGFGSALVWACRFEVHIDQVIGLAYKVESIAQSA